MSTQDADSPSQPDASSTSRKNRKKPTAVSIMIGDILRDSGKTPSQNRPRPRIPSRKPSTISEKIAFLATPQDDSGITDDIGAVIHRRRKPKTMTGTVAYLCNTSKTNVRTWFRIIALTSLVAGLVMFAISRQRKQSSYWDGKYGEMNTGASGQYQVTYEEYQNMTDKEKAALQNKLGQGSSKYRRLRKVYDGLSDKQKKQVRSLLKKENLSTTDGQ